MCLPHVSTDTIYTQNKKKNEPKKIGIPPCKDGQVFQNGKNIFPFSKQKMQNSKEEEEDQEWKHVSFNVTPTDECISRVLLTGNGCVHAGCIVVDPFFANEETQGGWINPEQCKILLVRQKFSNLYGLPKGHIEENETHFQAAVRELKEETGLNLKSLTEGVDFFQLHFCKQTDNGWQINRRYDNHPMRGFHNSFSNNQSSSVFLSRIFIKNISFFLFVLLRPSNQFVFDTLDSDEIDSAHFMSCDDIEQIIHSPTKQCNRTITMDSLQLMREICRQASQVTSGKVNAQRQKHCFQTKKKTVVPKASRSTKDSKQPGFKVQTPKKMTVPVPKKKQPSK